ncbi:MAG: GAF domain-containing protein [Nitrospirota bacterium]|nr:GAF domain-containing protein [Nitrospirota bacterium]MDP2383564.1 GAF domain-containing protein [Nitrospirota bacterium]MDP3597374.1 GAF domain-containing protein [Nitrospirota bacterium]
MEVAPLPQNESARLKALHTDKILDTVPEEALEELIRLTSQICGISIASVRLIDLTRQWFKAKVEATMYEASRGLTCCAHAMLPRTILDLPNTLADSRMAINPLVTENPFIRLYAGTLPNTPEKHALRTFSVIDCSPRQFTDEQGQALTDLRGRP